MEVVVTTGATGHAKLQSNHYHQQTNIKSFLQTGCPSCRPTSTKATNHAKLLLSSKRQMHIQLSGGNTVVVGDDSILWIIMLTPPNLNPNIMQFGLPPKSVYSLAHVCHLSTKCCKNRMSSFCTILMTKK